MKINWLSVSVMIVLSAIIPPAWILYAEHGVVGWFFGWALCCVVSLAGGRTRYCDDGTVVQGLWTRSK